MNKEKQQMLVASALEKISRTDSPKVKKVALAYSGGVDSSLGIALLKQVYRAETLYAITVDIGQGKKRARANPRNR